MRYLSMSRYFNDYEGYDENSLEHHGVLGMKWGVRRYQNPDGSLTNEGKKRYYANSSNTKKQAKGIKRYLNDLDENVSEVMSKRENKVISGLTNKEFKDSIAAYKAGKVYKSPEIAKYDSQLDDYKKRANNAIAKLDSLGYTVKSSKTLRYYRAGAEYLNGTKYKLKKKRK